MEVKVEIIHFQINLIQNFETATPFFYLVIISLYIH